MNPQQRLSYMKAMGIPIWLTRGSSEATRLEVSALSSAQTSNTHRQEEEKLSTTQTLKRSPSSSQVQSYEKALQLIEGMDSTPVRRKRKNTVQVLKKSVNSLNTHSETPAIQVITDINADLSAEAFSQKVATFDWSDLQTTVENCQYCEMASFRTHAVLGSGDKNAEWMFIGEAPDAEDDLQGQPFLGQAGLLMDNILAAIRLKRDQVYFSNILKCRPANDRDPYVDEAKHCLNYLQQQIHLIKPKVIVVVGRVATQHLLKIKKPLGKMRGAAHYLDNQETPVIVTYHPRYLLRQASAKRKVWEDIQLALSIVEATDS